jgi:formylglycine-generating enzyme required for sulfatase activity
MELVRIPAGEFMMGSDSDRPDEKPAHKVVISKPFYLGKYEVTQAEWQQVMGTNPSHFKGDPNRPVERVSWTMVQEFISKLNAQEGHNLYRLPTEAEWEYAARAGTKTARFWGDAPDRQCGYANGADQSYHKKYPKDPGYNRSCDDGYAYTSPVGSFKPNAFGLYDMLGNSWEFTQDCLSGGYDATDHDGAAVGGACQKHVIRGASWGRGPNDLRVAKRGGMSEEVRGVTNSIRLVREL